jgi:hypothetical protein
LAKTISISDDDFAALLDVHPDPKFWINNMIEARIYAAVDERRNQAGWMTVAISFAQTGGDPENGRGVLAHGLATGAFKDAAARQAEAEAALAAMQADETESA